MLSGSLILDGVEYKFITLDYAKPTLNTNNIKLVWDKNDIAPYYDYWFNQ